MFGHHWPANECHLNKYLNGVYLAGWYWPTAFSGIYLDPLPLPSLSFFFFKKKKAVKVELYPSAPTPLWQNFLDPLIYKIRNPPDEEILQGNVDNSEMGHGLQYKFCKYIRHDSNTSLQTYTMKSGYESQSRASKLRERSRSDIWWYNSFHGTQIPPI